MISLSIVSGHENDRRNIISLLSGHDDLHITSVGADAYDALRSAMIHRPNIIIMDFFMNDIESPALVPIIKRHSPLTKLIVIYSPEHSAIDKALGTALSAGISGCLLKESDFENLASSVRSVFHGGLYVGSQVRHVFNFNSLGFGYQAEDISLQNCDGKQYCFSPTESQIFSGIALGHKDDEIANQLNISTGALRNNVNRIKKETGLKNRTQIAVYALFNGMINLRKIRERFKELGMTA